MDSQSETDNQRERQRARQNVKLRTCPVLRTTMAALRSGLQRVTDGSIGSGQREPNIVGWTDRVGWADKERGRQT